MAKLGTWSTTAGNNNSTPPDGWPEGQAPSTVNDCAREMMAQIKTYLLDSQYGDLASTVTRTGATTFTTNANVTSIYHVGRKLKAFDGANTFYSTIISASFSTNTGITVRFDDSRNAFTTSFSSVAVASVSQANISLPEQAYKNKNVIINGAMSVWQRSAAFALGNNTRTYTADRWAFNQSSGAAVNINRGTRTSAADTVVPTVAQAGVNYVNSLGINVSAGDAAIAAGEFFLQEYRVEGYDWAQIAHQPNILSFWYITNLSGVFGLALRNTALTQSIVFNVTASATGTWTKYTAAIPPADATAAWDYSTGTGLYITFALAAGSSIQGGAGNWTAANIVATSSQTNFLSAGANIITTGWDLREGTDVVPPVLKPYDQELNACRRYFQNVEGGMGLVGQAYSTNQVAMRYPLKLEMRTAPSATFPAAANASVSNGGGTQQSVSAFAAVSSTKGTLFWDNNVVGTPLTQGQASIFLLSTAAVIALDAEL